MRFLGKTKAGQECFAYDFVDQEVKQLGDNEITIIGSTESLDRDGEIIKMSGWLLDNYQKNPVILPAHMYWEPAIGKGEVRIENNKLVFDITFPEKGINPVADVYKGLYKGGFMKACSVGFIGLDYMWGEKDGDPRRIYNKQELLELSLCSVPSNPQALLTDKSIAAAISAKKIGKDDIKVLEDFMTRLFKREGRGKYVSISKDDSQAAMVECPSCNDTFDLNDGITGEEVGTDCMKCPTCGVINKEDEYVPVKAKSGQGDEPVQKQGHLDAEAIKTIVEETIKEIVPGIVQESLKTILKNKSHYSALLFTDQVPAGTIESVAKELGDSLKSKFKLN